MTCRARVFSNSRRLRNERRASEPIESRGSSAATTKMTVGTAITGMYSTCRPSKSGGTTVSAIAHVVQRVGGANGRSGGKRIARCSGTRRLGVIKLASGLAHSCRGYALKKKEEEEEEEEMHCPLRTQVRLSWVVGPVQQVSSSVMWRERIRAL